MDAGGYQNPEYWRDLDFRLDGKSLGWREAVATLLDATGRPGPATWELGRFPAGEADHPVAGVSWYEAKAYARFRGRDLPTIYHWVAATIPWFAPFISPLSNFSDTILPAGASPGVGPFGAVDMAGNVREWVLNAHDADQRWIMGGGHTEPEYVFSGKYSIPASDRSAINGIRLVTYPEPFEARFREPFNEISRDNRLLRPVSDEVFDVLREQFVDRLGHPRTLQRSSVRVLPAEPGERLAW